MRHSALSSRLFIAGLALAGIVACDAAPPEPTSSPIAGHTKVSASDSSGGTVPGGGTSGSDTTTPGLPTGPGKIHGTVLGQFPVTPGQDSMALAPKLAGVTVAMYPCVQAHCAGDAVGAVAATLTTDAKGTFASPTLPGGYYIVVFTPTAQSGYRGVYAWFYMNPASDNYGWWVMLPKN